MVDETPVELKYEKLTEPALLECFRIIHGIYLMGYDAGKLAGMRQTTIGGSPAVSPEKNIVHGAGRGAKKPNGRK